MEDEFFEGQTESFKLVAVYGEHVLGVDDSMSVDVQFIDDRPA